MTDDKPPDETETAPMKKKFSLPPTPFFFFFFFYSHSLSQSCFWETEKKSSKNSVIQLFK